MTCDTIIFKCIRARSSEISESQVKPVIDDLYARLAGLSKRVTRRVVPELARSPEKVQGEEDRSELLARFERHVDGQDVRARPCQRQRWHVAEQQHRWP